MVDAKTIYIGGPFDKFGIWVDYWGAWVWAVNRYGFTEDRLRSCPFVFDTAAEAREYVWSHGGRVRPPGSYQILSREGWAESEWKDLP